MNKVNATLMIYDGQIEVEISGTFYREQAERGPSYSSGGEPGYPAHVEDIVAKLGRDVIELSDEDMERAEVALVECGRGE